MEALPYRQSVCDTLRALAWLEHVSGPVELLCEWFDDLYHPKDPAWCRSFTDAEREALATFDHAFAARADGLTQRWDQFQTDPGWQEVSAAAQIALQRLGEAAPDA